MTSLSAAFNVHNLLGISVSADRSEYSRVVKRIILEYTPFLQNDVPDPVIRIKIGAIRERPHKYTRVDGKYLVNETSLYCEDSYKVAKWRILINGFDSDVIELRIEPNWFAKDLIPAILVTPLIGLQLMKKGCALVHAAGIANAGGTLITGFGSSGKTASVFRAAEKGYKILGDDHVILKDGHVISFPTALSLFSYNIPPSMWSIPWRRQVQQKALLNKATFGYANLVTKVPIEEAFPNAIATEAVLKMVLLLQPSVCDSELVTKIERSFLVEAWLQNIVSEASYFFKYLFTYLYSNPSSLLHNYEESLKKLLVANLGECKHLFKVVFPRGAPAEFLEIVQGEI